MLGPDAFFSHRMVTAVKRVKGRVRQPGFVEMQILDITIEHALDGFGVVKNTVVGGLRDGQHAWLDLLCIYALEQRVGLDLRLDRSLLKLFFWYRANDAEMVARRLQEHRNGAGHDDRMQDGLVAVAVHHHHIARSHRVVPDHLVAGTGAVGHKKAVIGIENTRRIALGGSDRTIVVQQLAEFFHRVADVGAQHVLAKKLVEHLPDRAFQKSHPAGVSRAMPGVGAVFGVVQQSLEKRRLHAFQVTFGFADDMARHKLWRVLEHVDKAMQLAQDIVGNMARGFGLAINVNRHVQVSAPHFFNEVAQVQHRRIQVRARRELFVVNRQDKSAGAALLLCKLRQIAVAGDTQHLKAFRLNRLGQRTDAQTGGVFGTEVFVDDDDGKAEFHQKAFAGSCQKKRIRAEV